jgi:DNA-binding NarL/FixJ family response regulator
MTIGSRRAHKFKTPLVAATKPERAVRILIVDDHEFIRRAVGELFDRKSGLIVCGEAADGRQAVRQFQKLRPEMVIMDISMPVMNGLDAAKEIKRLSPKTKIVILTMFDLDQMRDRAHETGIDGWVAKSEASANLLRLVKSLSE